MENSIFDDSFSDFGFPLMEEVDRFVKTPDNEEFFNSLKFKQNQFNFDYIETRKTQSYQITPTFTQTSPYKSCFYDRRENYTTPTRPTSRNHDNSQIYVTNESLVENPDEFFIIDCRWPYEYKAGTIKGAINLYSGQALLDSLINVDEPVTEKNLLFFCEFSQCRSVRMCQFLIKVDSCFHGDCIYYNNVYILEGGFKKCHENANQLIEGEYVSEQDPRYIEERKYYSNDGRYDMASTRLYDCVGFQPI